mgnify:CR=1 FL=1
MRVSSRQQLDHLICKLSMKKRWPDCESTWRPLPRLTSVLAALVLLQQQLAKQSGELRNAAAAQAEAEPELAAALQRETQVRSQPHELRQEASQEASQLRRNLERVH